MRFARAMKTFILGYDFNVSTERCLDEEYILNPPGQKFVYVIRWTDVCGSMKPVRKVKVRPSQLREFGDTAHRIEQKSARFRGLRSVIKARKAYKKKKYVKLTQQ